MNPTPAIAIVIEPNPDLAATVVACLKRRHFTVVSSTTHAGAAELALAYARVDFLVAAVPAPGEDRHGAYLTEARGEHPGMGVVVMLADPYESVDGAPPGAVKVVKPFSVAQLEAAIDKARTRALSLSALRHIPSHQPVSQRLRRCACAT